MTYCCKFNFDLDEHKLCKSAAYLALDEFHKIYPHFFPNLHDIIIKHVPGETGTLDIMVSLSSEATLVFSATIRNEEIPEIKILPLETLEF